MPGLALNELTAHVATRAHSDDSLDRLDAALTVAGQLDNQADALVDHFVAAARTAGRSWTEIGARLGVTKQAARKRFTDSVAAAPVLPPDMTLRPQLRTCLTAAERHAQQTGAAEVGTDHLLAGLLADGVAAAILDKLGVTAEAVNTSTHRLFGISQPASEQPPPLSADAICAIEAPPTMPKSPPGTESAQLSAPSTCCSCSPSTRLPSPPRPDRSQRRHRPDQERTRLPHLATATPPASVRPPQIHPTPNLLLLRHHRDDRRPTGPRPRCRDLRHVRRTRRPPSHPQPDTATRIRSSR